MNFTFPPASSFLHGSLAQVSSIATRVLLGLRPTPVYSDLDQFSRSTTLRGEVFTQL